MVTTVHTHFTETTKNPPKNRQTKWPVWMFSFLRSWFAYKKKKKALLLVDGCVKRQAPEGTLEKESEMKAIIYQDIAGMQISVSASLFRQRFLVCSSGYNIMFWTWRMPEGKYSPCNKCIIHAYIHSRSWSWKNNQKHGEQYWLRHVWDDQSEQTLWCSGGLDTSFVTRVIMLVLFA